MIFCGQCGLQLAPGDTRCSRCGTAVELQLSAGEAHPNAPTVESQSFVARTPPPPETPQAGGQFPTNNPQKLVLRPNSNSYDYGSQAAFEATTRMEPPQMRTGYPGYTQGSGHPTMGTPQGYRRQAGGNYPTTNTAYPAPRPAAGGYQPTTTRYQAGSQAVAAQNVKGRAVALVLVLLGLLFIIVAMVLLFLQHNGNI
jgi:hypothetical protein